MRNTHHSARVCFCRERIEECRCGPRLRSRSWRATPSHRRPRFEEVFVMVADRADMTESRERKVRAEHPQPLRCRPTEKPPTRFDRELGLAVEPVNPIGIGKRQHMVVSRVGQVQQPRRAGAGSAARRRAPASSAPAPERPRTRNASRRETRSKAEVVKCKGVKFNGGFRRPNGKRSPPGERLVCATQSAA